MNTSTHTSNPETSTPDSWENRIETAATFLGLSVEDTEVALKELGVEKEPAGMEMLSDEEVVPFGDLRKIFCDERNIPIAKVRMAMKYLRGPKDSAKTDTINPEMIKMKEKYGIKPKLEHIPTEQLLEDYDPNKKDHPITIVLQERFGKQKVIVFKPDSTEVDIEATANYVADLDQGYPEEETVESQGELVRLYKVGEIPNQIIEEDPLFVGEPLKRGRSIINRVNWSGIDIECRKFVRLLLTNREIYADNRQDIRDVVRIAKNGLQALKEEFPETALDYREKKKLNTLPNLTMTMEQANEAKTQNPFGMPKIY